MFDRATYNFVIKTLEGSASQTRQVLLFQKGFKQYGVDVTDDEIKTQEVALLTLESVIDSMKEFIQDNPDEFDGERCTDDWCGQYDGHSVMCKFYLQQA